MFKPEILEPVKKKISAARKVYIITHRNPDGDTLGAALSWHHFFKSTKKPSVVFCTNSVPEKYQFLPLSSEIISDQSQLDIQPTDLIIMVDTDLDQSQVKEIIVLHLDKVINIDHHFTNASFGAINLVNPKASATCEIIFYLFRDLKIPVSPDIATCLYSGIFIDTGSFTNLATNVDSLQIASILLTLGAKFRKVTRQISENRSIKSLKLWGQALDRLYLNQRLKIIITVITQEDIDKFKATEEDIDGIANFLNNLSHPEALGVMVLRQEGEMVRASMRSTKEGIDVSRLARLLGGGGHKKAAGFGLPGKIVQTEKGWKIT